MYEGYNLSGRLHCKHFDSGVYGSVFDEADISVLHRCYERCGKRDIETNIKWSESWDFSEVKQLFDKADKLGKI